MVYPVFNKANFPSITTPITVSQDPPFIGLGYKAVSGTRYFNLKMNTGTPDADLKIAALYDFWKTDCKYGTTPFMVALPFFGEPVDDAYPNFLVRFTGGFTSEYDYRWKLSQKWEVVGTIQYLSSDAGDYIVNDAGDNLVTDPVDRVGISWG